MRKFLIPIVAAAATVGLAAPASAQWFPQPYGYGQGYGYGYSPYGHSTQYFHALRARINQLEHTIRMLDSRNMISEREAWRLRSDARQAEWRLQRAGFRGLSRLDMMDIQRRISRIENRLYRTAGYRSPYGYGYGPRSGISISFGW